MLRIKGASKKTAPREVQEVFAAQEKQYGTILNTAKVYGLRPTDSAGRAGVAIRYRSLGLGWRGIASSFVHESRQHQWLSVLTGHQRVQWDATWGIDRKG